MALDPRLGPDAYGLGIRCNTILLHDFVDVFAVTLNHNRGKGTAATIAETDARAKTTTVMLDHWMGHQVRSDIALDGLIECRLYRLKR